VVGRAKGTVFVNLEHSIIGTGNKPTREECLTHVVIKSNKTLEKQQRLQIKRLYGKVLAALAIKFKQK